MERLTEKQRLIKLLIAKEVANIGSVPLPKTNIFTTNEFNTSTLEFKRAINKGVGNINPRYRYGY